MEKEVISLSLTLGQVNHILTVLGEVAFVKAADPIMWIREQAIPQHAEIAKKYPAEQPANAA
jgi:hypothetical protein